MRKIILTILITTLILYLLVFICIMADFIVGIRKAKQNGVFRTSFGYRKTIKKIAEYYSMLLIFSIIDIIQMSIIYILTLQLTTWMLPFVPVFTAVGTCIIAFIELKSIKEKQSKDEKARINNAVKTVLNILKNPENRNVLLQVLEFLKNEKNNGEN